MSWIKNIWQKFQQTRKQKHTKTANKNTVAKKQATIKKQAAAPVQNAKSTPTHNLKKAQTQALQVDKQLHQKGINIPKGKNVKTIDPPTTPTPSAGWKPPTPVPPKGRGRSKGKGMSR